MAYAVGHAGARIYYEITGARGPNVVLIQGLGLSSRFWFEMPRILSGDHRVIDGATGARFLQDVKTMLEKPYLLVV